MARPYGPKREERVFHGLILAKPGNAGIIPQMSGISGILPYIQLVLSVLLIGSILMQRSEAGLGGAFGGDAFSSTHYTRRGFERTLFIATIVIAVLFALTAFLAFVL